MEYYLKEKQLEIKIMKAYIVAGFRSAVGKANKGGFRFMRSDDLAGMWANIFPKSGSCL